MHNLVEQEKQSRREERDDTATQECRDAKQLVDELKIFNLSTEWENHMYSPGCSVLRDGKAKEHGNDGRSSVFE